MAVAFNADEVFEMGEQIERNGRRFYLRAAEQCGDPGVKQLLERLAEMEADHEVLFVEMRAQAAREGMPQVEYDPDLDVPLYLQSAADTHVFNVREGLQETLTGQESAKEILRLALGFEKDSVVFFLGVKELMPEDQGKSRIDGLIKEEMNHIIDLTAQLNSLQGGS